MPPKAVWASAITNQLTFQANFDVESDSFTCISSALADDTCEKCETKSEI